MWVNIFWTIMPLYTILVYIVWMPPNQSQVQSQVQVQNTNQNKICNTYNKNQQIETPPKYCLNSEQPINEVELEFEHTCPE